MSRPLREAFDYTSDFSNSEKWDPGIARSTKADDQPVGLGSRFDLDVRFGRATVPMTYEITAYEAPDRVVLAGRAKALDAVDEIRFSTQGGATVIDYTAELDFHNALRFAAPLLRPVMNRVGRRALDGLAAALG